MKVTATSLTLLSLAALATTSSIVAAFVPASSSHRSGIAFCKGGTTTHLAMVKAGVSPPDEIKAFVESASDRLVVVDVRNPDASVEPGDAKSLAVAALPNPAKGVRPSGLHLVWDREAPSTDSMAIPADLEKDAPIITHCGGGGRGQKAKDYLESKGFTNVINGGGPKETECWAEFGSL